MVALGAKAFERGLTPETLFRASLGVGDEDARAWLDGFAHDLAVIRGLPETEERP